MRLQFKIIFLSIFFLLSGFQIEASNKQFTVVIDAGHGGHDSGAVGKKAKEKEINLSVALKFGALISENYPDVKVVYTRKKDIFIPLQKRADIANENNADIFFSIHTNATKGTTAFGTETFVLGLAKTQSNLEVAMRENAVMTLEDGYKIKYQGFDPKSVDSYIMFEYMQDRYLEKSLQLATLIEKQFKQAKRYSRGVRQAGFWVLHKSACPSVLIELGFISNPNEESFLSSEEGRQKLSYAIFEAFKQYKQEHDRKVINSNNYTADNKKKTSDNTQSVQKVGSENTIDDSILLNNQNAEVAENKEAIVFKIQLFAVSKLLKTNDASFKGLKDFSYYFENNLYKYTYGIETDFQTIENLRKSIQNKFPESYIIAFKGDKKIPITEAKKLSKINVQ